MADDITPAGKQFYIVYEDSKKDSYVTAFLSNSNTTGKGGEWVAATKYSSSQIDSFTVFEDFNVSLRNVGQPEMTWNPYEETDPSLECNPDNDNNCTK